MNIIHAAAGATVVVQARLTKARHDNNEITQSPGSRAQEQSGQVLPSVNARGVSVLDDPGVLQNLVEG